MLQRTGSLLLVISGLLLLLVGIGYGWLNKTMSAPEAATLPESILDLPLTQASYGREAVAEVTRLHGQSFPLSSGAFGMYGSNESMAMLWVTGTPARPIARQMVSAMENAIAESESPFTPMGSQEINGRTVYVLEGMGQQHYYFRSGSTVIWLAVFPDFANSALTEVQAFYP